MTKQQLKNWCYETIVLLLFSAIFFILDVPCLFKTLIGLPCPFCGMTRSWHCVLHGEIQQAFFYQPLFWMVPVIILFLFFKHKVSSKLELSFWSVIFLLFLVVYACRMMHDFPTQEPMTLNKESILLKFIHFISMK